MQLNILKFSLLILCIIGYTGFVEAQTSDTTEVYKKRVLESSEIDFLFSYYEQDGKNAAVSGGIGTEELTDVTPTFVIAIPLNDDDILKIDVGVSAYTSASSSNVDPFDGSEAANPFVASTGASGADTWANITANYSHSSDDRNRVWSAKTSISSEYDYFSAGIGGSYTRLFNKKNTELSFIGNIFIDTWQTIYPSELRPFSEGPIATNGSLYGFNITGNQNYNPTFKELTGKGRQSYSIGASFIQILSKRLQGALLFDVIQQKGLLSTPFQRVYFKDVDSSFIGTFRLADDIERMPDNRLKLAFGGRLNFYINEFLIIKTYYRFYNDNWGVSSHTASFEIPIKIHQKFTLYPGYRYYNQTAADYFASYSQHLSTDEFYTSDFDLSEYNANQYSFAISYTDVFTGAHIGNFGLKSIDIKYSVYERNTGLSASLISFGVKFVQDKKEKTITD
ncbi:MAG: DUF3570 domain-containing protein [Flavobacteriales bacterium]|nr:DUF3570 domain-containing protein [Flavobacteriales bacterium]